MYVNCKIHHEKMNEYLDNKEIIPYCLSCIVNHHLNLNQPPKPTLKERIINLLRMIWINMFLTIMMLLLACIATIITGVLIIIISDMVITHFKYNAVNKDVYYGFTYFTLFIIYLYLSISYMIKKKKDKEKINEKMIKLEKEKLQIQVFNYQNKVEQYKKELKKNHELSNITLKNVLKYDDERLGAIIKSFFVKREYVFFKDYHQKDTFINFILKQNENKIGVQYRERNTVISDEFIQEIQRNQQALKCKEIIIITNNFFTKKRFDDCTHKNIHLWSKESLLNEILKDNDEHIPWKDYLRNSYNFEKINQIPLEKWM